MMFSIMATSAPVTDPVSASPSLISAHSGPTRRRVTSALIAMLIGAAIASLGFGGVLYYFARLGRLPKQWSAAGRAPAPIVSQTHLMALEPLLVNLADEGGSTYLRLSLTLQVVDTDEKKASSTKDKESADDAVAAVRDTALTVTGRETANNLLATDGKERLKAELRKALAEHNSDLKVKQMFFTDFLVQR